jgi:bifunctional enzyme CysN/CysC
MRTAWYRGPTLLQQLERTRVATKQQSKALRMPIQWVNRPDAQFRGFCGMILSGALQVGDQIAVFPSRKTARIKSIVTMDGPLQQASAADSITVTLDREIDITRGDMLVSPESPPKLSRSGEATLVWMSEQPLVPGKSYWFKQTTRRTSCEIEAIRFRTNVNTLEKHPAAALALNEIGRCQLKLHDPVMFDDYTSNRETGSFILVDRITHETVGAGMFCDMSGDPETTGHWNEQSGMVAASPARMRLSSEDRYRRYGHKPLTILITGLSSSGKTSIAMALEEQLFKAGHTCILLDAQNMRMGLSRDLGFTAEERSENLRRAAEIAKLINDSGQICVAAFVAPSAWVRQRVRELIGKDRFFHVHLSTSREVCRGRDVTGQYQAADKGEINNFPGVTFDYETPLDADLTFDTQHVTIEQVAATIYSAIKDSHLS